MKSIFELLGFLFTALITGVLAFLYIGHSKNSPKTEKTVISSFNKDGIEYETAEATSFASVPKLKIKEPESSVYSPAQTPSLTNFEKRKKTVVEEKPVWAKETSADKLKKIYEDETFVQSAIEKWKKKVADASKENDIRPTFLLANCVVKSYLGNYAIKDFSNDIGQHISDVEEPANDAVKFYDNHNCILRLVKLYELEALFPKIAKPIIVSKTKKVKEKERIVKETPSRKAIKPVIEAPIVKTTKSKELDSEKSFREMVARQEGFDTWQGLQFLADPETKKNAEKRVKLLASAARVK
jgi:hypothetical protein